MSDQTTPLPFSLPKVFLGLCLVIIGIPGDVDSLRLHKPYVALETIRPIPVSDDYPGLPLNNLKSRIAFSSGDLTDDVLASLDDKYAVYRPLKVHAALVLGIDGGHRQRSAVKSIQPYVTQQEYELARRWVKDQSHRFDALRERRIAIMNLSTREIIPELLEYNDIAAQLLTKQVHDEIIIRIQNQQRETRRAQREANRNRGR